MTHAIRSIFITALIVLVGSFGLATDAQAKPKKKKIDKRVDKGLVEFHEAVNGSEDLLASASGVLVFPSIRKRGGGIGLGPIMVGGGDIAGDGALIVSEETVGYYRIATKSSAVFGSAQGRQILVFLTQESLDDFLATEEWVIGASFPVAIMTDDGNGNYNYENVSEPVLSFAYNKKGALANLSRDGATVTPIEVK